VKFFAFLLLFAVAAFGVPIYTIANLGGTTATGYAVNNAGTVAGWSQNASGGQQAFVSIATGLQALPLGTGTESYAYGINNAGIVVGNTYINGNSHGTIWNGFGVTDLGVNTYATAINNSGEVAGSNGQAFVAINGQVENLVMPSGMDWSAAYGINDAGIVTGDGRTSTGTFLGLVWNPDGSVVELGTLGGSSSQANDVNNSGEVVGFASLANGYQHAFSETGGGALTDLGTLGGSSYAYGINNGGEVVGYSYLNDGDQHAFLVYDGNMLDLNSLLPANSGWVLEEAFGINDSGQITGMGLYDGQASAFLMTDPPAAIPEPSENLVVAAGLGLVALWRRRGTGNGKPRRTIL
jgi:probable HAF family extracellular repeat protein